MVTRKICKNWSVFLLACALIIAAVTIINVSAETLTVVFYDKDGNSISVDGLTQIGIDDILAKGDFVTQFSDGEDYYVLSGWKDKNTGIEYGVSYTASADAQLSAIYSPVLIYTPSDLNTQGTSVGSSTGKALSLSFVEDDEGNTYYRILSGAEDSLHHGLRMDWNISANPIDLNKFRTMQTEYSTNAASKDPRIAVRLSTRNDIAGVTDQNSIQYSYAADRVSADVNLWKGSAVFDIPSTFSGSIYYIRFVPFCGDNFFEGDIGHNSDAMMDLKYIGFFSSSEQAGVFDYDEFYGEYVKSACFDVEFKDNGGKVLTIKSAPFSSLVTPKEILENKPYGFTTQYRVGSELYVISGWKNESSGKEYGLNYKVNAPATLTAIYKKAIIYTPDLLNKENITIAATDASSLETSTFTDEFRHYYYRMFDKSSGNHHAFRIDWNLGSNAIDPKEFGAVGVKSVTNAAKKADPRQAVKVFTGADFTFGQTSTFVNYSDLYNNNEDDPLWEGTVTFALPNGLSDQVYGIRFMPFGADYFESGDVGYGVPVYSDIEYIGLFSSSEAGEIFDFDSYKDEIDKETKALNGDVNGDGKLSTIDVVILSRYLANWKDYDRRIYKFNCDINKDGFVTALDSVILARRIANWKVEDSSMETSRYYIPEVQPDILGGTNSYADQNWTSDQIIQNIYEPLRTKYPEYITRENIGKDASGTYDMWCYTFEPENYEYTVYIQGGVHGRNEIQGYMGLARLMQLVCDENQTNPYMQILRTKVKFIVVPIVNVWDVSKRALNQGAVSEPNVTYSPNNSNNVNLNRNWLTAAPEQEIQNIKNLLAAHKDEIDFGFDFHTDPEGVPGFGSYLLIYPHGVYDFFSDRLKETCLYLENFNRSILRTDKKAFKGDDLNYPAGSKIDVNADPNYARQDLSSSCSSGMWSEFGIPAATPEHGDRKFSPTRGDSIDITKAVELYANMVLQQLNYDLKEKIQIVKGGN